MSRFIRSAARERFFETYGEATTLRGLTTSGSSQNLDKVFFGKADFRSLASRKPVGILGRWSSDFRSEGGGKWIPLVSSFDPDYLEFLELMSQEGGALKGDAGGQWGLSSGGQPKAMTKLGTVAGYSSTPLSYTPVNNTELRKAKGLEPMTARQKLIARKWAKIALSSWKECSMKVPLKSTSGMPRFTSSAEFKKRMALSILELSTYERLLETAAADNRVKLVQEFEFIPAAIYQTRASPDAFTKKRLVADLEYALSAGKRGRMFDADKSVYLPDSSGVEKHWPTLSATRKRVIMAFNWGVSCGLQPIWSGHLAALFHRWPSVFHVNTPSALKKVIDGKFIAESDVGNFDNTIDVESLLILNEELERMWHPGVAAMDRLVMNAPYFYRPLEDGGKCGWVGNMFNPDHKVFTGNRSGDPATAFKAKWVRALVTFFVIDSVTGDALERMESILDGKHTFGFINGGDDSVEYSANANLMKQFIVNMKKVRALEIDNDPTGAFCGMMIVQPDFDVPSYEVYGQPESSLLKCWSPERGIESFMRPYWPHGFVARINSDDEATNPHQHDAWRMASECWDATVGKRVGPWINIVLSACEARPIPVTSSSADLDVLLNEEKIHYLYTEHDITPEVLDRVVSRLPYQITSKIAGAFYNGEKIDYASNH